ncbi:imm11 family protein [Mucilaginibacter auburnensis]|uniref:Immunity MXAN-0049 protein domain-containing protein n=1 Tax=Mucilaginibacter auburnensis TaxID=1457233 RepID=A0A2H9VSP3_9SPHI|nr:DUF1629 domain-containing protein [Mucilaginibacter auburnensis]PJJ83846.1 hypothetical protein CLV57_0841 [Mucilaginibacter auburnensis]
MNYYRLSDELYKPKKRWFLGSINFDGEWDFWKYVRAGRVIPPQKELFVSVRKGGLPLDFTMADFELLIVNEKVKDLISESEVQLIPVKVADLDLNLSLMVVNNEFDCVDEGRSIFDKWQMDDPIRPDRAGKYKSFAKMIINDALVPDGSHIFRIKNYSITVVVSEVLKNEMEAQKVSGVKFEKLS